LNNWSAPVIDLAARLHSQHLRKLSGVLLLANAREPRGIALFSGQSHRTACRSSSGHARCVSRRWCAHGCRTPLSWWCFITRWRWCRRSFDWPLHSVAVAARREAQHRFHSVVVGIGELLPGFSTRNVMTILNLRCLLGIRHKLWMFAIPTLNA